LLGEVGPGPIQDATDICGYDFAGFIFTGNPIGVFGRKVGATRIESIEERIPQALLYIELVNANQFIKIMADLQQYSPPSCSLVSREYKSGKQRCRPVLDRKRIGEPQIVFGDDIWNIERHENLQGRGEHAFETTNIAPQGLTG
jgi:hypothetical protein